MKEYIVQAFAQETIDSFDAHNAPELIRCKDCKHFRKEEKAMVANQYCSNLHKAVTNDWFCADGERQEGR